jgi:cell division septum initiation protein DivIVA
MTEDKLFGVTMFGFDKNDVNTYIEKMAKEFETKLRQKDEEISLLKLQNKDLKHKYDEVNHKSEAVNYDKGKIAEVLMKAQENAERILEEARETSRIEKQKVEAELSRETHKIFSELKKEKARVEYIKQQLEQLRKKALLVVQNFENDVESIIDEEAFDLSKMPSHSLVENPEPSDKMGSKKKNKDFSKDLERPEDIEPMDLEFLIDTMDSTKR